MKKIITIGIFALIVIACNHKAIPAASPSTPSTPATAGDPTIPDAAKTGMAKPNPEHTEMVAQGKTVYTTRCGKCHELKNTEAYTAQRWEGILKNMIPKARLNDTEGQQVTAYVMENAKK